MLLLRRERMFKGICSDDLSLSSGCFSFSKKTDDSLNDNDLSGCQGQIKTNVKSLGTTGAKTVGKRYFFAWKKILIAVVVVTAAAAAEKISCRHTESLLLDGKKVFLIFLSVSLMHLQIQNWCLKYLFPYFVFSEFYLQRHWVPQSTCVHSTCPFKFFRIE